MANVLLGVTGSVAAVRVPALHTALTEAGHAVKIVTTEPATYFFDPNILAAPNREQIVFRDRDEWPGREQGQRYEKGEPVIHIELRNWADLFLIAPLDANTLAKLAVGLCDNCLTCVWRAWDSSRPIVIAPAMNTLMWQNSFTRRHLRSLAADAGAGHIPAHLEEPQLIAQINARSRTLRVIAPIEKRLACGDTGVGAMAEVPDIVEGVNDMLAGADRPATA